jgi:hypothetical protein
LRYVLRTLLVMRCQTTRRDTKHGRTSIPAVHIGFDGALRLESIDERAGACPIQGHAFRERVLIDAGCVVKMNQDGRPCRISRVRQTHGPINLDDRATQAR